MVIETCSEVLGDGRILEIAEVALDPTQTFFAVSDQGRISFQGRVSSGDRVFVPVRRDDPILSRMHLANAYRQYESTAQLASQIGEFLNTIVRLPISLQLLLGAFVVHSWSLHRAPSRLFPVLRGPRDFSEPLLRALALVCRNALVIADATAPALLSACSRFTPTCLIMDSGLRQDVVRILKAGLKPDVVVLRQQGALSSYCPILLACPEELSDPDLLSDAMVLSLPLSEWPRVERLDEPEVLEQARGLRNSLLQFRLHPRKARAPVLGDAPPRWTMKQWSMFRCFAAPFSGDEQFCAELRAAFQQDCEVAPHSLSPAKQATLSALFVLAHGTKDRASVKEISDKANEASIKPRRSGAVLDALGFAERKRGDHGNYEIEFHRSNLERIHSLARFYGIPELETCTTPEARACCPLCRDFHLVSEAGVPSEQESKLAEERQQPEDKEEHRNALEQPSEESLQSNVPTQEELTGSDDSSPAS